MVHITCTILVVHQIIIAISVIVVLAKYKAVSKVLHILSFHLSRLHCIKERIKTAHNFNYVLISQGRKKKAMRLHNAALALASKHSFLLT